MNIPLCVLLPVYNAQQGLEGTVSEILDVLPELSRRFQLCVVDDGSTDDTAETAHALAARYPQINVFRHPLRLGLAETIQTGLDNTHAEIIFVDDEDYALEPDDLRTLWQLRDTERRLTARADRRLSWHESWMDRLSGWKPSRARSRRQGSFQIIRRGAFEYFRLEQAAETIRRIDHDSPSVSSQPSTRPNFLGKVQQFAWDE